MLNILGIYGIKIRKDKGDNMFGLFKKKNAVKKEVKIEYAAKPVALNLSKNESLGLLNLRKETVKAVCLNKDISGLKSRVGLVLDFSGSMRRMYQEGTVQALIERIIPIALEFDDNEELDLWIFENGFKRLETVTKDNYYGLAERLMSKYHMGGTNYAPVMKDVISKYTVEEKSELPGYIIFITDGDNFDKPQTEKLIKDTCMKDIFWQFVGIGSANMDFLENLDDMKGRKRDSVDFFKVERINYATDESLYSKLLDEYPSWIKNLK